MGRPRCNAEGCTVGASHDGLCASHAKSSYRSQLLSMEPLVAIVDSRGGATACGLEPGSSQYRYYSQAKKRGIVTPARADRLAHSLLGCHPCEVWREWFGPYGLTV